MAGWEGEDIIPFYTFPANLVCGMSLSFESYGQFSRAKYVATSALLDLMEIFPGTLRRYSPRVADTRPSWRQPFEEPPLIHGCQDGLAALGGRSPSRQHAITDYASLTQHSSWVHLPLVVTLGDYSLGGYLCSELRSQWGEAWWSWACLFWDSRHVLVKLSVCVAGKFVCCNMGSSELCFLGGFTWIG